MRIVLTLVILSLGISPLLATQETPPPFRSSYNSPRPPPDPFTRLASIMRIYQELYAPFCEEGPPPIPEDKIGSLTLICLTIRDNFDTFTAWWDQSPSVDTEKTAQIRSFVSRYEKADFRNHLNTLIEKQLENPTPETLQQFQALFQKVQPTR